MRYLPPTEEETEEKVNTYEPRVCNTETLLSLCALADKYEFNRRANTELLAKEIDPDGIHLLQCFIQYHRASIGPTVEPAWPDHHRCYVYCKVTGSDEPVNFWLDVPVQEFLLLHDAKWLEERMADPVAVAIASAAGAAESVDR